MYYNYRDGKDRVKNILNSNLQVIQKNTVPCEDDFTFENAYKCWVTSIFVDIRNSTDLFAEQNQTMVAKIIKSFSSEVIEILRDSKYCEEIGIRGDCVYAIYSSPLTNDVYDVANKAFWVNTLLRMLNKLFDEKQYLNIKAGIGISSDQELIVKAGRKGVGINSKVWIGNAVTKASKLSSLSNKNSIGPIAMSSCTYNNIIEILKNKNSDAETWFTETYDRDYGTYYHGSVIITDFDKWIDGGMK